MPPSAAPLPAVTHPGRKEERQAAAGDGQQREQPEPPPRTLSRGVWLPRRVNSRPELLRRGGIAPGLVLVAGLGWLAAWN